MIVYVVLPGTMAKATLQCCLFLHRSSLQGDVGMAVYLLTGVHLEAHVSSYPYTCEPDLLGLTDGRNITFGI